MLIPLLPPPGINSDDTAFAAEGRWVDCDGFRFRNGRPESIGGALEMADATAVAGTNKMLVFDAGGTMSLAVAGATLRIGEVGQAGTDITPASGWAANARHCLAMFGDILLATVAGGSLYESSGGAQAIAVAAAPDEIRAMIVTPSRQVMALGCNEESSGLFNSRCIRWSDIESYADWTTSSSNNAGEHVLPGQADLVSGCVLGDHILLWTEGDLWLATFLGDPAQTFSFTRVGDVGIIGLDAFAIYRQTVYWVGPDSGLYAYQVGGIVQRIPCPVFSEVSRELATPEMYACAISRYGEIWLSNTGGLGRYYVYCVDESLQAQTPVWFKGSWALAGFANPPGAMVDSPLLFLHNNGTTTIVHSHAAGRPWQWDCLGHPNGGKLGMSGAYIQSADISLDSGGRRMLFRAVSPDFEEQHCAVLLTLYMRDSPMSEPVAKGPYMLATSHALAICMVNDTLADGDTSVSVDVLPEAMAQGVVFTFFGINAWEGGDTGEEKRFTVTADFVGGNGTLFFTPPVIASGEGRNVVSLPPNNTVIRALSRKGRKCLAASGRLAAVKFATAGPFWVRFGKPMFECVPLGER